MCHAFVLKKMRVNIEKKLFSKPWSKQIGYYYKTIKNTLETQCIIQAGLREKPVTSHFIATMMELVHFYNSCVILNNTLEADRLQEVFI